MHTSRMAIMCDVIISNVIIFSEMLSYFCPHLTDWGIHHISLLNWNGKYTRSESLSLKIFLGRNLTCSNISTISARQRFCHPATGADDRSPIVLHLIRESSLLTLEQSTNATWLSATSQVLCPATRHQRKLLPILHCQLVVIISFLLQDDIDFFNYIVFVMELSF